MVEIFLGKKEIGNYKSGDANITIKKQDYENDFEQITYNIAYQSAFSYAWYNWWTSYNTHNVYIKNRANKIIFTSYVTDNSQVVLEVESYHSKYHPEIPLVLGFKRNDGTFYYPYRLLWSLEHFYGLPRHSFEKDNLKSRLNSDNKRRNKITFKLKGVSDKYHEERDDKTYGNFIQYKYSVDYYNYFEPYLISTDTLFKREKKIPIDFSIFNNVDNKEHDFINIFYTKKNIALLAQFVQHSVLTRKTTYQYFKRKTKDGTNWDDISDDVTNPSVDSLKANKSENDTKYPVNLVENTSSGIISSDFQPESTNKISVKQNEESTSDLKYKSYEHSLTQQSETLPPKTQNDFFSNVAGLRLFIGSSTNDAVELDKSVEIKLYSSDGNERKYLYYDSSFTEQPSDERKNKVYCYFYDNDNVPLMIYGDGCFYKPKSLSDYFNWVETTKISSTTESEYLKTELDQINKEFNVIKLETTSGNDYGEIKLTSGVLPENFYKFRIKVTKEESVESVDSSFKKIKHTATNTGPIGKITFKGEELKVLTEQPNSGAPKSMTTEIKNDEYNTVCVYYHSSDSEYQKALLLGFSKGASATSDMFFELNDNTPDSKWKRVSKTDELGSDNGLATKINEINYNIKKSIMIKLEQQSTEGYDLMLVQNETKSTSPKEHATGTRINVTTDSVCQPGQNYKCYKHTIPSLNTTPKPSDVGGLRFYLDTFEITFSKNSGNLVIYYINTQVIVNVYFHKESSVPLLLRYNKKFYGPTSRDDYFGKWVEKSDITNEQGDLQQKLDQINRSLNIVDISIAKPGTKYGLLNPVKDSPSKLPENFYNRVLVKTCVTINYRQLTHSTLDGGPIGNILYQGKPLTEIVTNTTQANEVSVYYELCDKKFSYPLLIEVKSKGESINSSWFFRTSGDELTWKQEHDKTKYATSSKIENQLKIIGANFNSFSITIKVEQSRMNYDTAIFNGICIHTSSRSEQLSLTVDLIGGFDEIKVKHYHTYNHHLITYFMTNNELLKSKFERTDNFPLCLRMTIIDRDLDLIGNNGSVVTLIYKDDSGENKHNVVLYYHEDENHPYEIPLLMKFGNKFFAPKNKNVYFSRWDEIVNQNRFSSSNSEELKRELDSIYNSLNTIDLTKTKNYGIRCCNQHSYYHKKGGFSTKRIEVTKFTNKSNYTMYVHRTVNNLNIGTIKDIRDAYFFKEHYTLLTTQTINEVAVIYKGSKTTAPILVLLNKGARYTTDSSYTHGYYYQNKPARGDTVTKYIFKAINSCNMMGVLKGEEIVWFNACGPETTEPIREIWKQITSQNMTRFRGSPAPELDTTDCKGPTDIVKQPDKCLEDDIADESTYPGSESSAEDLDQDGMEDTRVVERQSGSVHVDTVSMPEQIPAPPRAASSDSAPSQNSLQSGGNLGQDDRPKVGLGASDDGQGLGSMGAGAKAAKGPVGPSGPAGKNGETGPQATSQAPTESSTLSPPGRPTTLTNGHGAQEHSNHGGGGNGRSGNGGGASPNGLPGPKGEAGAQSLKNGGSGSGGITLEDVKKFFEEPVGYGSTSAVGGVGVMATVGAVAYKKCVVGSRINHSAISSL